MLTLNGLTAADEVIVPLQCETLAHRGVGQFLRTITDVQQITNADLKLLGALPTLYDSRTTHSRDVLLDVADRYDMPVLAPPIPRTVRFAEASASGASVLASRKNKALLPTATWPVRCSGTGRTARRWRRTPRVRSQRDEFVAALLDDHRTRQPREPPADRLAGRASGMWRSPLPVAGSKTSYPPSVTGTSNRPAITIPGPVEYCCPTR